jgi:hypothetical protein
LLGLGDAGLEADDQLARHGLWLLWAGGPRRPCRATHERERDPERNHERQAQRAAAAKTAGLASEDAKEAGGKCRLRHLRKRLPLLDVQSKQTRTGTSSLDRWISLRPRWRGSDCRYRPEPARRAPASADAVLAHQRLLAHDISIRVAQLWPTARSMSLSSVRASSGWQLPVS